MAIAREEYESSKKKTWRVRRESSDRMNNMSLREYAGNMQRVRRMLEMSMGRV